MKSTQNKSINLTDMSPLVRKIDRLRGMSDQLISEKARIIMEIDEHQTYLSKKDEVSKVLQELQDRAQAKTKTIYEELLTQLVHEVKGYDTENHRVVLNTRIRNNRPWLDIEIENAEGHRRDIAMDKGGSIENIVAMGLRFVTLSRTGNRRVLFFDEADKDLNKKYIPNISRMLYQLAAKVGIQVVYVSHHDPSNFEGYAKIINLVRVDDSITTEVVSDVDSKFAIEDQGDLNEHMEDVGIKYIRLFNVKQHKNTLIELSPLVTVITGDNDIGKSTVIQAVDSVNKNKGRDGLIRDNQSSCRIEIGLEDEMSLSWSYKRRGSKKTRYSLNDSENIEIQNSESGNHAPEWLSDYLGMASYKDFDIHINDKHSVSFILDSKISGHKRAEILSLGKETNQTLSMIKNHNAEIENKTKLVNQLKKDLRLVKNRLEVFRHLNSAEEILEDAMNDATIISTRDQEIARLKEVAMKKAALDKSSMVLVPLEKVEEMESIQFKSNILLSDLIVTIESSKNKLRLIGRPDEHSADSPPVLSPYYKIASIGKYMTEISERKSALNLLDVEEVEAIEIKDNTNLLSSIGIISSLKEKSNPMENLPLEVEGINFNDSIPSIKRAGADISNCMTILKQQNEEIRKEENTLESCELEKQSLMDSLGESCPVCGSVINNQGAHAHA